MLLERGRGSLLAEKAEGAGFFNAGIAGIAEASFWKIIRHSFDSFLHSAGSEVQKQTDPTASDCIAFTSTISWPPTIKSTR